MAFVQEVEPQDGLACSCCSEGNLIDGHSVTAHTKAGSIQPQSISPPLPTPQKEKTSKKQPTFTEMIHGSLVFCG
jgi:hypothetical protein